jgi:alkylation response protein AidB-like acyl-CoA dehydrogenase
MVSKTIRARALREEPRRVARQETVRAGKKLEPSELRDQLARSARELTEGLEKGDLSAFFEMLRSTDLPFLLKDHIEKPQGLYASCFEVLHRLGGLSPAVALAIENHYFVSNALATFPIHRNEALAGRRQLHVRSILDGRLLVANTNTHIHTGQVGVAGTVARRENGGLVVSGAAAYMSLAREGDLIFFLTDIEKEGPALLVAPLRGNPQIEVGPLLFPRMMVDSDTRRVKFHDSFIPEEGILMAGKSEEMAKLISFQYTWHLTLIPAAFLGAAARALEEARLFLRSVNAPNGKPLADLDGMVVDVGRMAIRYRSACVLVHQAGAALEAVAQGAPLPAFENALQLSYAAKLVGTRCAEEIVGEVRRMIGGRAFSGSHPLERLSQEVMFGPLAGAVNASIERRYGQRVLGENDFLSNRW